MKRHRSSLHKGSVALNFLMRKVSGHCVYFRPTNDVKQDSFDDKNLINYKTTHKNAKKSLSSFKTTRLSHKLFLNKHTVSSMCSSGLIEN